MRTRRRREITAFLEKMKVVSEAEAEEADLVACLPAGGPRYFPDDVETVCANCGVPIRHRPHAPTKPKKVCLACVAILSAQDSPEN